MIISDCADGDVVRIGPTEYRLMIKQKGGFLCRYRSTSHEEWSDDHRWLNDFDGVELVTEQPRRNPKARKAKGRDLQDPIAWKGTTK